MKVLVTDPMSEVGIKIFRDTPGISVDVKTGLSPEELKAVIGNYDGLAIRGATRVSADVIAAADKLKVIGRAGIGLENVDVDAASQRGIVVMNTPEGNTITTAEHAIAMMMALSRNIPEANKSLKKGLWEKERFKGRELFNKTLGLIGSGRVGRLVAERARGLKMNVIVYDPYIKPETIENLGLEPVGFDELLERSDYITIHAAKTEETVNMIDKEAISNMKKGVMLINCGQGGVINEDDLYEGLVSGRVGGAALDVFATEPPGKLKLMELDNFICTPHLAASTEEAQDNVSKEVAEQITGYLLRETVKNAVNLPSLDGELMDVLRPYVILTERMGSLQTQLAEGAILEAHINYQGKVTEYDLSVLTTAMLKGLLTPILKDDVNFINAPHIAAERGIKVKESRSSTSENFSSLIELTVKTLEGENFVSGTAFGRKMPRLLQINNFRLEAIPEGHLLLIENVDSPGVIGKITSILGREGVNINRMQVGEERQRKSNIIVMTTDLYVNDDLLEELSGLDSVHFIRRIEL